MFKTIVKYCCETHWQHKGGLRLVTKEPKHEPVTHTSESVTVSEYKSFYYERSDRQKTDPFVSH